MERKPNVLWRSLLSLVYRHITTFNAIDDILDKYRFAGTSLSSNQHMRHFCNIVINYLVLSYADLIMGLGKDEYKEFEQNLCRLLQKARAASINVIIATQRPSAQHSWPFLNIFS